MLLEKGKSLMLLGDLAGAEEALTQYVYESHGDPAGLLALARALLWQGRGHDAYAILNSFPSSSEFKPPKTCCHWQRLMPVRFTTPDER